MLILIVFLGGGKRLTGIGSSGLEAGIRGVDAAAGVNIRVEDIVGEVKIHSCLFI